jgi:hypothetical protein
MLTRRRLLSSLLAVGGAAAFGLEWLGCGRQRQRAAAVQALAGTLPEGARALGLRYLRDAPDEAKPELLTRLLVERLYPPPPDALDAALEARVAATVRADFAARRTVLVEGWVLAETAARLCALAALESERSPSALSR